jgi:hypothetical protein
MNPLARYFSLESAVMATGAVSMAALVVTEAVIVFHDAMSIGGRLVPPLLALLIAVPLALGGFESLRGLRGYHRPNDAVYYLHNVALAVLIAGLLALAPGREWIVAAAVPALAVASDLRRARVYYRDRSTCRTDPTLPPVVLSALLKRSDDAPVDQPDSRPEAGVEDQVCPHIIDWKQLRAWGVAEWIAHRVIRLSYFGGTAVVLLTVAFDSAELLTFGLDDRLQELFLLVGVPMFCHLFALSEWRSGPQMHRQSVAIYAWSIAAFAMTAGLAGWEAMVLDRPYLWAFVPLALASAYLTLWRAALYSHPSECETRPELHPRVRARLKA